MRKRQALDILRSHFSEIHEFGVRSVSIPGSMAGEARRSGMKRACVRSSSFRCAPGTGPGGWTDSVTRVLDCTTAGSGPRSNRTIEIPCPVADTLSRPNG